MARAKKPAEVKYGIEITKPHSQEMYDHNDMVAAEMKSNILKQWNSIIKRLDMDSDWELKVENTYPDRRDDRDNGMDLDAEPSVNGGKE